MGASTKTKTLVGTFKALAPEVIDERPYGQAIDWWALGIAVFEMLVGERPFTSKNRAELFEQVCQVYVCVCVSE